MAERPDCHGNRNERSLDLRQHGEPERQRRRVRPRPTRGAGLTLHQSGDADDGHEVRQSDAGFERREVRVAENPRHQDE